MRLIGKLARIVGLTMAVAILAIIALSVLIAVIGGPPGDQVTGTTAPEKRSCRTCLYGQADDAAILGAHELVKPQLRDPGSAIWDGKRSWSDAPTALVVRVPDGGIAAVCGTVNAKNGFGGYTGDQIYIVNFKTDTIRVGASDDEFFASCT